MPVTELPDYEGADDMRHLSALLQSLGNGLLKLRPDQGIVAGGQSSSYDSHVLAARATDGSYALVYDADGGELALNLTSLAGPSVRATWFDPSNGAYIEDSGKRSNREAESIFEAPSNDHDWVLLLRAKK